MSSSVQLVTRAFRRLQAIDINEQPTDAELTHGLDVMTELINGWTAGGINTNTQILVCDVTSGDNKIKVEPNLGLMLQDTSGLLIGLNVVGSGIPNNTRVNSVETSNVFTITEAATSSGGGETLTFSFLPMPIEHEGALVALLAARLSEDLGLQISAKLVMDASEGWQNILSSYIPDRKTVFDRSIASPAGTWNANTDWVT